MPFHPFKSSLAIRVEFIYPRQRKARLTKGDKEFGSFSVIYLIKYVAFNHIKRGECAKFMTRGFDK